jgi:DNA helicase II / ATP-dependent DNA helicase PcrA
MADRARDRGLLTTEASDGGAKILMIAHRMAARRLEFLDLFEAFNNTKLSEAFDAGRAWPLTPFSDVMCRSSKPMHPLCERCAPTAESSPTPH